MAARIPLLFWGCLWLSGCNLGADGPSSPEPSEAAVAAAPSAGAGPPAPVRQLATRQPTEAPQPHFEAGRVVRDVVAAGRLQLEEGAFGPARTLLDQAVAEQPDDPDAHYWRGRAAEAQGDDAQALADYHQARELDETFVRPIQQVADYWVKKRECSSALPYLEQLVELLPEQATSYFNRGHCRFRTGDLAGAVEDAITGCEMGHDMSCRARKKVEAMERWSETQQSTKGQPEDPESR